MKKPPTAAAPISATPPVSQRNKSSNAIYHTNKWRIRSRRFLQSSDGFCVMCRAKGVFTPADTTDHIIPLSICADPWDENNWQPLCGACNREKGRTIDKQLISKHKL